MTHRADPAPGDTIALLIEDERSGERLFHAPALARIGAVAREWMARADCLPVGGLDEPLADLAPLAAGRKLLTQLPADHPLRDGTGAPPPAAGRARHRAGARRHGDRAVLSV